MDDFLKLGFKKLNLSVTTRTNYYKGVYYLKTNSDLLRVHLGVNGAIIFWFNGDIKRFDNFIDFKDHVRKIRIKKIISK